MSDARKKIRDALARGWVGLNVGETPLDEYGKRVLRELDTELIREATASPSALPSEKREALPATKEHLDVIVRTLCDYTVLRQHFDTQGLRSMASNLVNDLRKFCAQQPSALPKVPREAVLCDDTVVVVQGDEEPRCGTLFMTRDSALDYSAEHGGIVYDCVVLRASAIELSDDPPQTPEGRA